MVANRIRKTLSITLSPDLYEWAQEQAATNATYRNVSHLVEIALLNLRDSN